MRFLSYVRVTVKISGYDLQRVDLSAANPIS